MRLLLIDDNERFRDRLAAALTSRGVATHTAGTAEQALQALSWDPTHALVDLRLGSDDGLTLVGALRHAAPTLQIVVLTGYGSIATAVEAMRLGAHNYLQKPADADMVLAAFDKAAHEPLEPTQPYAPPSLARTEWEHIQRVLADCAGNVSEAARRLGMHRRTLQRKLQKYPPRT